MIFEINVQSKLGKIVLKDGEGVITLRKVELIEYQYKIRADVSK